VEVQLVSADVAVVADQRPGEALHLREPLDTGEAAADEGEGEQPPALRTLWQAGRPVERGQHGVAHGDRLLDPLEPDRGLQQAGDGEEPGHGARGHDDLVVGHRDLLAVRTVHPHQPLGVVDAGDVPGDDVAAAQVAAQRDDDVPGLDRPSRDLGQKRLVGHVRGPVDHRHAGLTLA
jgi:hypothetical protein